MPGQLISEQNIKLEPADEENNEVDEKVALYAEGGAEHQGGGQGAGLRLPAGGLPGVLLSPEPG